MAGRILVLDDEENYAEMLQELLREHDFCVDMATRPAGAISLLEEIPYDLVISDYKMPVMDGAGFLKRARELYPNLPFILVSGLMNTPELVKVANMSVTLVMEKPLNTSYFLRQVARFSDPMTEDEKLAMGDSSELVDSVNLALPSAPRFISAKSVKSIEFITSLWALANKAVDCCFIWEPLGGEAELALKDISAWKGYKDKPVRAYDFSELLLDGGVIKIQELCEDCESSHIVMIRLDSSSNIADASVFAAEVAKEQTDLFLAFVLTSPELPEDFLTLSDSKGLVLPSLTQRPSDVAHYIKRFIRIASERLKEPREFDLSVEVVHALLSNCWSSYREIQEVVTALINEEIGQLSPRELVDKHLPKVGAISAGDCLRAFLAASQVNYLNAEYKRSGLSVEAFVKEYELDASIQSVDDFSNVPLLLSESLSL